MPINNQSSKTTWTTDSIPGGFDSKKQWVNLKKAIGKAENDYKEDANGTPETGCTQVFLLGKVIYPFVEKHLKEIIG